MPCSFIVAGPDSDPSVRNVALWFGIDDKDVTLCTPQQAKRYRWKRGLNNNNKSEKQPSNSVFEYLECFFMVRPHDRDAFDLTTRILKHRLGVLRSEHTSESMRDRYETLKALQMEKNQLQTLIEGQVNHWKRWAWPINDGRITVNDETPVPAVDSYYFQDTAKMSRNVDSQFANAATEKIWESFVAQNFMHTKQPLKVRCFGSRILPHG